MGVIRIYVGAAAGSLAISADIELSKAKQDKGVPLSWLLLRTELPAILFFVPQ